MLLLRSWMESTITKKVEHSYLVIIESELAGQRARKRSCRVFTSDRSNMILMVCSKSFERYFGIEFGSGQCIYHPVVILFLLRSSITFE